MKEGEGIPQGAKIIDITQRLAEKKANDPGKEYPKYAKIIILEREREKRHEKFTDLIDKVPFLPYKKEPFIKLIKNFKKDDNN